MARNEKSKSCAIGASLAETRGMFAHTSEMIQTTFPQITLSGIVQGEGRFFRPNWRKMASEGTLLQTSVWASPNQSRVVRRFRWAPCTVCLCSLCAGCCFFHPRPFLCIRCENDILKEMIHIAGVPAQCRKRKSEGPWM